MAGKLLLCLIFTAYTCSFGQSDSTRVQLLKISPLHVFDLDNGLSFSWEKTLRHRAALNLEAGYGNSSMNLWAAMANEGRSYDRFSGFSLLRTRLEWRKYLKNSGEPVPEGGYFGYELLGKYIFSEKEFTIGRDPIGNQPQYFEQTEGKVKKWVGGFHVKLGKQWLISDLANKNSWYADVFGGLGFRCILNTFSYPNQRTADLVSGQDAYSFGTIFRRKEYLIPVVSGSFGLRIGRKI